MKGKTEADRYREQFRNKYNDTVKKDYYQEDLAAENKIDQLIALLQEKQ